jgi:AcrR family transcriptional regulator
MSLNQNKPSRGRPKTLDREYVLDVAMNSYWKEDIGNLSLNEICRRCDISKPGLYREFLNEDGLMKAVILKYHQEVLSPVQQMLSHDAPFQATLDNLILFAVSVDDSQGAPKGCLLIKMREAQMHLGEATRAQIDLIQEQAVATYKKWIECSQAKGEFTVDMTPEFAATYIDAQLGHASSQLARGEDPQMVKRILMAALSILK